MLPGVDNINTRTIRLSETSGNRRRNDTEVFIFKLYCSKQVRLNKSEFTFEYKLTCPIDWLADKYNIAEFEYNVSVLYICVNFTN